MDIKQLSYFISAVNTMSFTEAARRHGLTQPAISHQINELEKELGCKLFLRQKRNIKVTDEGLWLLPRAMDMVEEAEKISLHVQQLDKGYKGSISIAAVPTSSKTICKCLSELAGRYPEMLVDITFTTGRGQMTSISESKYDFHFATKEMVPLGNMFDTLVTGHGQLCLVLPSSHPMADIPLDFSRLKEDRFLAVTEAGAPALTRDIMNICKAYDFKPNVVCKYDRVEAVVLAVSAGLGISILPDVLAEICYSDNVSFIKIHDENSYRTEVVAWRREFTNPASKLFLEVLYDLFNKAPDYTC